MGDKREPGQRPGPQAWATSNKTRGPFRLVRLLAQTIRSPEPDFLPGLSLLFTSKLSFGGSNCHAFALRGMVALCVDWNCRSPPHLTQILALCLDLGAIGKVNMDDELTNWTCLFTLYLAYTLYLCLSWSVSNLDLEVFVAKARNPHVVLGALRQAFLFGLVQSSLELEVRLIWRRIRTVEPLDDPDEQVRRLQVPLNWRMTVTQAHLATYTSPPQSGSF